MWRLTMSDGAALLSPELNEAARAEAIAAMASRMAAVARIRRRRADGDITEADEQVLAQDAPADCDEAPWPHVTGAERPPLSSGFDWRRYVAPARNTAIIAAMASCGFAVVVLAQSPDVAAWFGQTAKTVKTAPAAVPASAPQPQIAAASPAATPAWGTGPAPGAAARQESRPVQTPNSHKAIHKTAPVRPATEPVRAEPVRAEPVRAEPVRAEPRRPPAHAATAVAHAAPKPRAHETQEAKIELPRWLTADQPAPQPQAAAPLVMSPPPHDLALPPPPAATAQLPIAQAPVAPQPAPQSAPPWAAPAPRPPLPGMVVASSGNEERPAYAWPPYRPPFEPPSFPPYGSPYGGYGGGGYEAGPP